MLTPFRSSLERRPAFVKIATPPSPLLVDGQPPPLTHQHPLVTRRSPSINHEPPANHRPLNAASSPAVGLTASGTQCQGAQCAATSIKGRPLGVLRAGGSLRGGKKVFLDGSFAKRPRVAHMFNNGWWRLAVGGWWRLSVGGWRWRLVAVGGGWWLVIGGWWRLAVVGGWRLVAAGGWQRLAVGGWRWLVVGGWWSLGAVPKGGP